MFIFLIFVIDRIRFERHWFIIGFNLYYVVYLVCNAVFTPGASGKRGQGPKLMGRPT